MVHGSAIRLVHPQAHPLRASAPKTPYCVPLFDGAGVIGFGDDEPEPSVLGGVAVRLAVVVCGESLLAMLFFQLARTIKPISSKAIIGAITVSVMRLNRALNFLLVSL